MASSIITSDGLNWSIQKSFGGEGSVPVTTETVPDKWLIGDSATAPSTADSDIGAKVPYTYTVLDTCDVADWTHIDDAEQEVLNETGQNVGTGCLNIPVALNTGTGYFYKIMSSAVNLSASGMCVYVFVYVSDKSNLSDTNPIIIELEDSGEADPTSPTNYSQWYFQKADLLEGEWTTLKITALGTPDNSGTAEADLSIIKNLKIIVNIDGSYATDTLRMDEWVYATDAEHKKDAVTDYPVLSETYNTITNQVVYATGQAVGFKIQEIGFINSNEMLFSHGVTSYVRKTADKEVRVLTIFKYENKT